MPTTPTGGRATRGRTPSSSIRRLGAIGFQAVAEAVRLAAALSGGRADSRILQEFGGEVAARDGTSTARIDDMLKDLEAVQGFAADRTLSLPVTTIVSDLHCRFVAAGVGPADAATMIRQFEGYGVPGDAM